MPALVFNTCCGCIELRTGCLIIGYLNLVCEIILFAAGLMTLLAGAALTSLDAADAEDARAAAADAHMAGGLLMVLAVILLLIVFFLFAFTIVLLVGLHQNKRGHLKAYLIYSYIFLVIAVIGFFASFGGPNAVKSIIQNLITILLQVYFTLVIRSHYLKMDEKRPQIYNTA